MERWIIGGNMSADAVAAVAMPAGRLHLRVAWLCGAVLFLEGYDIASVGYAVPSSRDLWPSIVDRLQAPAEWSRIDLCVGAGVVAGVTMTLVLLPKALLLLVYHL